MLRLGEALQDVVLLVSDPKKIKRSQKKKEEIAGFLDYVRITFDCDVIQSETKKFIDEYIDKAVYRIDKVRIDNYNNYKGYKK